MKKRRFIPFLIILVALLKICSAAFNPVSAGSLKGVKEHDANPAGALLEKKNTLDVLVTGDSLSYTSISPMKLWEDAGITSYDCGQSGQRIPETLAGLKNILTRQKPKVILMETDLLFRYQGIIKEFPYSLDSWACRTFPVFQYHNRWQIFVTGKKDSRVSYKGFQFRTAVVACDATKVSQEKGAKLSWYIRFYMKQIQELCQKKGVKLILYSSPSPKNYSEKRLQALKKYTKEQGITYLNLTSEKNIGIDWSKDALDGGDHLNIYGAQKVSAYLADYLQKNYKLKDHREEAEYSKWNEMLVEYNQVLAGLT